jgi:ComF family protein
VVYEFKRDGGLKSGRVSGIKWTRALQHWLLPARCIGCGGHAGSGLAASEDGISSVIDLCSACYDSLPFNQHACRHCALPLSSTQADLVCGRCQKRPPRYEQSWCAYRYQYPLQHLIRQLKFHAALSHAQVLGLLLANHLRERRTDPWPECFIPVPLHVTRYRQRGYNQVIEVGKYLQQNLPVPMRTDLVTRTRNTVEQTGLSRRERRANLRRAFTTHGTLPQHIALLDDVITTGSTVNELARVFKAAGVRRIEVWGLARAVGR